MKKLLCLLLCLMLPLAAMAAPTRDVRDCALSDTEISTMRAWLDGVVRDALPVSYDTTTYIGAYVYSCVEDGGCYVLECDVYLEEGDDSVPENAAEEALRWLCDATVCVKRSGSEYEAVSVEIGNYYATGNSQWIENTEAGFEVCLPDVFEAAENNTYVYGEENQQLASVVYRFEVSDGSSLAQYVAALAGEGALDMNVREDIGQATAQTAGMYIVICESAEGFHTLTLSYPAEREAEFTLYAEFMRNSFVVYSQSNG